MRKSPSNVNALSDDNVTSGCDLCQHILHSWQVGYSFRGIRDGCQCQEAGPDAVGDGEVEDCLDLAKDGVTKVGAQQ